MRHCWAVSRPRANCSVTPSQRPPWATIHSSTRRSKAQESIGKFNDKQSEKLLEKLHQAKTPDVTPFKQSVKEIDTLYNRPAQIAVDAENVYILPAKQQEE